MVFAFVVVDRARASERACDGGGRQCVGAAQAMGVSAGLGAPPALRDHRPTDLMATQQRRSWLQTPRWLPPA